MPNNDYKDRTDYDLIEEVRKGNEFAYRELYKRHREKIFGFINRFLSSSGLYSKELRDDIFQETHLIFIEKYLFEFRPHAKVPTLLCEIARILVLRARRHRPKSPVHSDELFIEATDSNNPTRELSEKELSKVIAKAINQLPDRQREVFILFFYGSLSYDEIAKVTGLRIGTIGSRLFSARERLEELLGGYLKET